MKISNRSLFCIAGVVFSIGVVKETQGIIELVDKRYEIVTSRNAETRIADPDFQTDIDKMYSHSVTGTGATVLPVDYEQDYAIFEDGLYVTVDEGQTWLLVPDDPSLGYARISDYKDAVSPSSIHQSGEKISIVYGGRGPENISVMTTDSGGAAWSVSSLSQTATHEMENGYENIVVDFVDDGQIGYLAALQNAGTAEEKIRVFWSMNSGVIWDSVSNNDPLYDEILKHFELQGM